MFVYRFRPVSLSAEWGDAVILDGGGYGQGEVEDAALLGGSRDPDVATLTTDEIACDVEAETEADAALLAGIGVTFGGDLVELFEDAGAFFESDADAVVFDLKVEHFFFFEDPDGDHSAFGGEFYGVVEQDDHDLAEACGIGPRFGKFFQIGR